ncbi:protein of unknown function [Flexibacter flexilis DSM 6793]|uniref:SiaC family regulatory phosphoprotein domain-containing protein n=1 Tax=Flexibacter flexilis DSM 6793 TaxID=927664 RepID=A0A1I1DDS1_9BACT|nr:DUF1987 domain-containing protein [Flexibacter flexilis]SFB72964.1 protein of unknown function [Flexibacter flexilis DSM 6793]
MELLQIEPTYCTPHVNFGEEAGMLSISGCSYSEDAVAFYRPLFAWIDQYKANPQVQTEIKIYFKYFNTASAKCVYEIMAKLSAVCSETNKLKIIWCYAADDEDIKQAGIDFSEILQLPFEFISIDDTNDDEQQNLINGSV